MQKNLSTIGALKILLMLSGVILLWVLIFKFLGLELDKEYFGYNREQCLQMASEKVASCKEQKRISFFTDQSDWEAKFEAQRDTAYCEKKKQEDKTRAIQTHAILDWTDLPLYEPDDPKCSFTVFIKKNSVEASLPSLERQTFSQTCEEKYCPIHNFFKFK